MSFITTTLRHRLQATLGICHKRHALIGCSIKEIGTSSMSFIQILLTMKFKYFGKIAIFYENKQPGYDT